MKHESTKVEHKEEQQSGEQREATKWRSTKRSNEVEHEEKQRR